MGYQNQKIFLSAKWKNLALITYSVPPEILLQYMPAGLEPDTISGKAFVSLVAFDFLNTKVISVKIPFHVNFPEINLRFYAKSKEKRGVVFISELVPKFFIARIANMLYNENYKSIKMSSSVEINEKIIVEHKICIEGRKFKLSIEG